MKQIRPTKPKNEGIMTINRSIQYGFDELSDAVKLYELRWSRKTIIVIVNILNPTVFDLLRGNDWKTICAMLNPLIIREIEIENGRN